MRCGAHALRSSYFLIGRCTHERAIEAGVCACMNATLSFCANVGTISRGREGRSMRGLQMAPPVLAVERKEDLCNRSNGLKRQDASIHVGSHMQLASITKEAEKQFDFFRILCEGAVAGATAGVVVETILYPIDTIKTRLQAAQAGGKIVLKGLYSGLAGNLAGVLPASAIFVGIYEPVKHKLLEILPENLSSVAHLAAGGIGGAAASLVRVPTEVVKQRMQTGEFVNAAKAVRLIVSKEGVGGLYAGYGSFLLRDLPFDAIQFCVYEQLRIGYKRVARRDLYNSENALVGAVAGIITGALTTPLDVVKTRLMVQGTSNQYNGISDCVQKILQEEGISAFSKGIGPRVLWIGIGGSIFFGVLEKTKKLLSERGPKHKPLEISKQQ